MTVSRQLQLCLLFSPNLLKEDPIARIWQESGVADIEFRQHRSQQGQIQAPALPSWQDFNSQSLVQLIEAINSLESYLPKDTNAAAHFILANLPANTQQALAKRWHPFWSNLNQRGIIDVDALVDDLLTQLLLQALSKQMAQSNNIVITTHLNRQRQTLLNWSKQQQAAQSSKMA